MAIPTKDRSAMVKEVIDYESAYYKNYPIDLCYYDSSEDDFTKNVIEKANNIYEINIYYERVNPMLCLDYKIIEMFKLFSKSSYDYFWLVNDSISISEEMIKRVIIATDEEYDLIRLPLSGSGNTSDYITEDINDWFQNCSQGMAHMASTIMSRTLLEMDIDWDYLCEKYVYNNTLDDNHGYFFTVGFYLEQIARFTSFKGLFIGNYCKWRRDSSLKKNQIYWLPYLFETWAKSYPETILKTPAVYTDKENTIRKSDNITPGRFSKEMLIHYRLSGIFDEIKYNRFKQYFKYITTETDEICYEIAVTPVGELREKYSNLISIEDEWESKLEIIERTIESRDIYLYGAGLYGEKTAKKLIKDGFKKQIKAVLVTFPDENISNVCEIGVIGIDDIELNNMQGSDKKNAENISAIDDNDIIIICALHKTAGTIKDELDKRGIHNYIGLFDV